MPAGNSADSYDGEASSQDGEKRASNTSMIARIQDADPAIVRRELDRAWGMTGDGRSRFDGSRMSDPLSRMEDASDGD
jgi:hypothetical protein